MELLREQDRILVDRQALAYLTGRSTHTIRRHCVVVKELPRKYGKVPFYDLFSSRLILDGVPQRKSDWTNAALSA